MYPFYEQETKKKKKKKKSTQSPIYYITKISSRSISKTNKIHGRKLESIPRGAHERIYLLSLDATWLLLLNNSMSTGIHFTEKKMIAE